MAPARVLPLPTAIVVRDARSDSVLAQFLGGKPAGEVCDALERLTGSPGCLVLGDKASQGAPLVLTESDVIQTGTYYWRVAVTRSSSQPISQPAHPPYNHTRHRHHDWSAQLAASVLAILILGCGIQLFIMLAALPFCSYRWSCAFSHYRSFISFIDGPFKVFAFAAAVQAAGRSPGRWLWFVKHLRFNHIRLNPFQGWFSRLRILGKSGSGTRVGQAYRGEIGFGGETGLEGKGAREEKRDSGRKGRGGRGGRGARKSSSCQGKQGEAGSGRGSDTGLVMEPGLAAARGLGKPGSAFAPPRELVNSHDSFPVASALSHDAGSPCSMPFSSAAFFNTSPLRPFASRGSLPGKLSSSLSAYIVRRSISDGGGSGDVSKRKED
ncbi:unnamed protein product [Closterium sp. Yama58-4]|nr:unnamed protein product [Closterium sp. Yama58-4]